MLGLLEVGWKEGTLGRGVFEGKGLVLKNGLEWFFYGGDLFYYFLSVAFSGCWVGGCC